MKIKNVYNKNMIKPKNNCRKILFLSILILFAIIINVFVFDNFQDNTKLSKNKNDFVYNHEEIKTILFENTHFTYPNDFINIDINELHNKLNLSNDEVILTAHFSKENQKIIYTVIDASILPMIINRKKDDNDLNNILTLEKWYYKVIITDTNYSKQNIRYNLSKIGIFDLNFFLPLYLSKNGNSVIGIITDLDNNYGRDVGPKSRYSISYLDRIPIYEFIPLNTNIVSSDYSKVIYTDNSENYPKDNTPCGLGDGNDGAIYLEDIDSHKTIPLISSNNKIFSLNKFEDNILYYKEADVKFKNNTDYTCWMLDENTIWKEKSIYIKDFTKDGILRGTYNQDTGAFSY